MTSLLSEPTGAKVTLPTLDELHTAAEIIARSMPSTPQYDWPLLSARVGATVWVKHENHTPIGAFKLRGALVYLTKLREAQPNLTGVITATKGNYGQGVAWAAKKMGLTATIVVPKNNSREKNAAMRALGVTLIEHGEDFQAAIEYAQQRAELEGLHFMPSFHPWLIQGTGTYALEFFRACPPLETVYVPIGMGSGICGVCAARNAFELSTEVVGVVTENIPAYARSFEAKRPVSVAFKDTIADGLACRIPNPDALAVILKYVSRVVTVSETDIQLAMQHYFTDTHQVAEGAAASALAAVLQERERMAGKTVGLILTGGNVDRDVYLKALV